MSAPSYAYNTEKLDFKFDALTIYNINIALKLLEYGSNIKTLFYLDLLLIPDKGDTNGFIGVVIEGGANAGMHATARYSKGRLTPNGGTTKYIILNEPLNTFGLASITSLLSDLFNGGIDISLTQKSAYWIDTDFYVRARIGSGSWQSYFIKSLAMNQTSSDTNRKVDINYSLPLNAGDILEVQSYASNTEGEKYTASQFVTIKAWLKKMRYGTTPQLAYESTTTEDVYVSTTILDLDTILYANENPGATMPVGFYMNEFDNFYVEINSSGVVINKNEYVPFVPLNYIANAQRFSSGSDFGDYELSLNIINGYISGQLADDVLFKVGQLVNPGDPVTDANLVTRDSYTFTGVTIPAIDSVYRDTDRNLAEPLSTYTWGWVAIRSGEQIGGGVFAL